MVHHVGAGVYLKEVFVHCSRYVDDIFCVFNSLEYV